MKTFLLILTLAGLYYVGYRVKEDFGGPVKEALNIEERSDTVDRFANYQHKLTQLEKQIFGPLGGPRAAVQLEPLLQQLRQDTAAQRISSMDEARLRSQISSLRPALQERNRFAAQYRSITQSNHRSFDPDVKARRTKLQQQSLERHWAETSNRLQAAYERQQTAR